MKKVLTVLGIVVLALGVPGTAHAVLVTFSEVTLPSLTLLDGTSYYDPWGISFTDGTYYAVDSRFAEDDYGITTSSGANNIMTVEFDNPTNAVLFGWLTVYSGDIYATAYAADGTTVIDTWSATGLSGDSTGVGALTGAGIASVSWHDGTGYIGVDSLEFTPVPEPATMLMLGCLGAGMAAARRAKRKKG